MSPRFWPHGSSCPGDGATVMPQRLGVLPLPDVPLVILGGHDGAWVMPHEHGILRAYDPDRSQRGQTRWWLLLTLHTCGCQERMEN